ncbi:MAG: AAA family ATPase [Kiloniellales bacterium]
MSAGEATSDQERVLAFLADPATHGGAAVQRIDTHGAIVFLAGDRAYKVKRAVSFPYMDFSTLERRADACRREVTLNRRTAPELYLGTAQVTREADGRLALVGPGVEPEGDAVEWLVVMRRFERDATFDHLAEAGRLTPELLDAVADAVAAFHETAEVCGRADEQSGGLAGLKAVIEENNAELAECPELFPAARLAAFDAVCEAALGLVGPLLERRLDQGLVRHCHGDLHLRNLVLLEGRPRLFDCIEFSDFFARIDLLYDVAYLLMDLDLRGLREEANRLFNRYLLRRPALEDLAALPLFLATRAVIRAKVGAAAAKAQRSPDKRRREKRAARDYFAAAERYLAPPPPCLVAVGGLSGSGKSTLAQRLAPLVGAAPGAVLLRSDVLRKTLVGVDPLAPLPESAYRAETTAQVYAALLERAARSLAAGHAVVLDAVHARKAERDAVDALARRLAVPHCAFWLEAPGPLLEQRVTTRRADASDATVAVVRRQMSYDMGTIRWQPLDASVGREKLFAASRDALGELATGGKSA